LKSIGKSLVSLLVAALAAMSSCALAQSGCDSLDAIPVTYQISYQAGIQGLFNANCTECHEGDTPAGGMDLSGGVSWSNLVWHESSQNALFTRVIPNAPELSLLFNKINCATPGLGHRMPLFRTPLTLDQQALIYDWIKGGAPVTSLDVLFRGEFETRN
jgi:hypothetical protein